MKAENIALMEGMGFILEDTLLGTKVVSEPEGYNLEMKERLMKRGIHVHDKVPGLLRWAQEMEPNFEEIAQMLTDHPNWIVKVTAKFGVWASPMGHEMHYAPVEMGPMGWRQKGVFEYQSAVEGMRFDKGNIGRFV